MKKIRRIISTFCVAMLVMFIFTSGVSAYTSNSPSGNAPQGGKVTASSLNIRTGPGMHYSTTGAALSNGTYVGIGGYTDGMVYYSD